MITRIEIDGFKSFKDFSVDLAPLTVIAGPNASGKSNLFDALSLLKGLANGDNFPFNFNGRGLPDDLFTKYKNEESAKAMHFSVEMLLPKGSPDNNPLTFTRLRYEVKIARILSLKTPDYFTYPIVYEKLATIRTNQDSWVKRYLPEGAENDYDLPILEDKSFFKFEYPKAFSHTPGDGKRPLNNMRAESNFALIGYKNNFDPHIIAVREELGNLNLLDLENPTNFSNYGLRNPSIDPKQTLNILTRIKKRTPDDFQFLSTQLNQIVSGLGKIDIYTDELNRATLTVTDFQGRRFPFESLSEGTLRIIALATRLVENDMRHILLLEEPENGIDPLRLENLVHLLTSLSAYPDTNGNDLRQVICTTHSPVLLRSLLKERKALVIFCSQPTYLFNDDDGARRSLPVSRMTPLQLDARENKEAGQMEKFTLLQAMNYFKELALDVPEFESPAHA